MPATNFNPSFANLAALHGLGGNFPHPIRPIGVPMHQPIWNPYSALPAQMAVQNPMQVPQGNLTNLNAIMQLLGQR